MSPPRRPQHPHLLELRSLWKESKDLLGFVLGEGPEAQSLESGGAMCSSSVLGIGSCQFVTRSTARHLGAPGTAACGDVNWMV